VSWKSKKQYVVSKLAFDAEYMTMSLILNDLLWVRNLVLELKVPRTGHLKVW
jgi:hypothetical protein